MNNSYDRDEEESPSEAPISPSKAPVSLCTECGIYAALEVPSGGSWRSLGICLACYQKRPEKFGAKL